VIDRGNTHAETEAIRALNDFLPTDSRVECVMIAIADGLMLVRKRAADESA
jgi:predicted O-methyltransferase YrrM